MMNRLLITMIGIVLLCLRSVAQEGTEVTVSESFEEYRKRLAEEAKARITADTSVEEHYKILDEYHEMIKEEIRVRLLASKSPEEYDKIEMEYIEGKDLVPEPSIGKLCKLLEEKFDDPGTVDFIMWRIYAIDGGDKASYGNPEALYWVRRVVREKYSGIAGSSTAWYLTMKGDAQDIELLRSSQKTILEARVAGMNVVKVDDHFSFLHIYLSVTNTGPQGVYVSEILRQCWGNLQKKYNEGDPHSFRDTSKIPAELLTMVVSFDAGGNPVCNVDLAKYGLTMPVLDVPVKLQAGGAAAPSLGGTPEGGLQHSVPPREPGSRLWIPAALAALTLLIGVLYARRKKLK